MWHMRLAVWTEAHYARLIGKGVTLQLLPDNPSFPFENL
jgi:hypothetical protein